MGLDTAGSALPDVGPVHHKNATMPPPSLPTPKPPTLVFETPTPGVPKPVGVTFAVYAPFGTDPVLSCYPLETPRPVAQHELVRNLKLVAATGVRVSALIDLCDDDTYLVEIPAGKPTGMQVTSCWKQQMNAHNTLAGFLRRTRDQSQGTALVLALEGHGAGYLPELDLTQLTTERLTDNGAVAWEISKDGATPMLPTGNPLLPTGNPLLPTGNPLLPVNHLWMSSLSLAKALSAGLGGRKLAALHFNNCFNLSAELLHTVAPYAEYAAGYPNYNFFTAGAAYPAVFNQLKKAGTATTRQIAAWFAEANRFALAQRKHHPTAGGVVQLSRMSQIATRVDALAKALITSLTTAPASQRPEVVAAIRNAIRAARQFDTGAASWKLETPDELTDLRSFAARLTSFAVNPGGVPAAAAQLHGALAGIKAYGETDQPWPALATEPGVVWDFSGPDLAMNILCPDPELTGWWDWRSPYYLQVPPDAGAVQPEVIDFLKATAWREFIIEYHRDAPFRGLSPAAIPTFPVLDREQPREPHPKPPNWATQ